MIFVLLARPGLDSAHIVSPSLVSKKLHLRINDRSQHSQREELQIRKIYIEPIAFIYIFRYFSFIKCWSLLNIFCLYCYYLINSPDICIL